MCSIFYTNKTIIKANMGKEVMDRGLNQLPSPIKYTITRSCTFDPKGNRLCQDKKVKNSCCCSDFQQQLGGIFPIDDVEVTVSLWYHISFHIIATRYTTQKLTLCNFLVRKLLIDPEDFCKTSKFYDGIRQWRVSTNYKLHSYICFI